MKCFICTMTIPITFILFLVVLFIFEKSYFKDKHGIIPLKQANDTLIIKVSAIFFFLSCSKRSNGSTLLRLPVSGFLMS